MNKTVLISGGGGFLGSVMTPMLLNRGYKVIVLDRFFFGKEPLSACANHPDCFLREGDVRSVPKNILKGVYAVFDLAALANDAASELNPQITYDINWKGRARLAALAKEMGVRRYVLASSCSVYGFQNDLLDENAPLSPLTTYAKSMRLAEQSVLPLGDGDFTMTALRQGTLYGWSPRMRFDLVVNTMTLNIFKDKKIKIIGGDQWRPLLHVEDSARAFIAVMEAESPLVAGKVFNVGGSSHNFKIAALAEELANALSLAPADITHDQSQDFRSYRVSCEKIEKTLGWKQRHNIGESAKIIYDKLMLGQLADSPQTRTLEWYKILLANNPRVLDDNGMV